MTSRTMRLLKYAIPLMLVAGLFVATKSVAQGPFTAQIENFWRSISTGGRAFTLAAVQTDGIGNTITNGLVRQNTTPATAIATVQYPPSDVWSGTAWNSSGAASETDSLRFTMKPQTVAGTTTFQYLLDKSIAGAAYINVLIGNSNGAMVLTGPTTSVGGQLSTQNSDGSVSARITVDNVGAYYGTTTNHSVFQQVNSTEVGRWTTTGLKVTGTFNATTAYQLNGTAGVGFALTHATPANQTGNATATLKMNGLGCTITPTSTGRVVFTVTGDLTNSTVLDGVTYALAFGTGGVPANAAAATGTIISATRSVAVAVAAQNQGFSITASVTGLALATATWFDLQIANTVGGTASMTSVDCTAHEI